MSITTKYSLAAVQLDTTADILISGITAQNLRLGTELDAIASSGEVYPRWLSLKNQTPGADFGTYHLATALGAVGVSGLSISTLITGLVLWLQRHALEGTRSLEALHRKFTIADGLIVPQTLTCPFQGDAVLTYRIIPISDGTNAPIAITEAVALPTAEEDDERFTLGPVTIGGIVFPQIRSLDIDFGINVVTEGGDSDIWPTFCSIESIAPRLTLRGIDTSWFSATKIPVGGLIGTAANSKIFLRKRALGGGGVGGAFVLDATATHIKFIPVGLAYIEDGFSATGSGAAETSLVMPMRFDGPNLPLTFSLAAIA